MKHFKTLETLSETLVKNTGWTTRPGGIPGSFTRKGKLETVTGHRPWWQPGYAGGRRHGNTVRFKQAEWCGLPPGSPESNRPAGKKDVSVIEEVQGMSVTLYKKIN